MTREEMALAIGKKVTENGGRCYFVGGFVRDRLLGNKTKDIDIEVHGVEPQRLRMLLHELGDVNEFGVSFGIFNLKGYDIDIAMPRSETCKGRGHRDFDIYIDPNLGEKKAALRRDFTINALMQNVITGEILDFFGGLGDLKNGIIRHVNDESFAEDPLRVLRACQFSARLGFPVAKETVELCREIDISTLAPERIFGEMEKALMQSQAPSVFFETLRRMNKLSPWFTELEGLVGVPQPPKHHPEGDVWTHTMMVLDRAACQRLMAKYPLYYMLSALCHDFGKPLVTVETEGVIRSIGHEIEGLPVVEGFLKRITSEKELRRYVLNMTKLHMRPNQLVAQESRQKSFNKLFDDSYCPEDLCLLSQADHEGRGMPVDYAPIRAVLKEKLEEFKIIMAEPYVMGRDLTAAGLVPDSDFSKILEYAHKLRLGGVKKEIALQEVLKYARGLGK